MPKRRVVKKPPVKKRHPAGQGNKPNEVAANSSSLQEFLKCDVCKKDYNTSGRLPHLLQCGHLLCSPCIPIVISRDKRCQTCRKPISHDSAKEITFCFKTMTLVRVIELITEQEKKRRYASDASTSGYTRQLLRDQAGVEGHASNETGYKRQLVSDKDGAKSKTSNESLAGEHSTLDETEGNKSIDSSTEEFSTLYEEDKDDLLAQDNGEEKMRHSSAPCLGIIGRQSFLTGQTPQVKEAYINRSRESFQIVRIVSEPDNVNEARNPDGGGQQSAILKGEVPGGSLGDYSDSVRLKSRLDSNASQSGGSKSKISNPPANRKRACSGPVTKSECIKLSMESAVVEDALRKLESISNKKVRAIKNKKLLKEIKAKMNKLDSKIAFKDVDRSSDEDEPEEILNIMGGVQSGTCHLHKWPFIGICHTCEMLFCKDCLITVHFKEPAKDNLCQLSTLFHCAEKFVNVANNILHSHKTMMISLIVELSAIMTFSKNVIQELIRKFRGGDNSEALKNQICQQYFQVHKIRTHETGLIEWQFALEHFSEEISCLPSSCDLIYDINAVGTCVDSVESLLAPERCFIHRFLKKHPEFSYSVKKKGSKTEVRVKRLLNVESNLTSSQTSDDFPSIWPANPEAKIPVTENTSYRKAMNAVHDYIKYLLYHVPLIRSESFLNKLIGQSIAYSTGNEHWANSMRNKSSDKDKPAEPVSSTNKNSELQKTDTKWLPSLDSLIQNSEADNASALVEDLEVRASETTAHYSKGTSKVDATELCTGQGGDASKRKSMSPSGAHVNDSQAASSDETIKQCTEQDGGELESNPMPHSDTLTNSSPSTSDEPTKPCSDKDGDESESQHMPPSDPLPNDSQGTSSVETKEPCTGKDSGTSGHKPKLELTEGEKFLFRILTPSLASLLCLIPIKIKRVAPDLVREFQLHHLSNAMSRIDEAPEPNVDIKDFETMMHARQELIIGQGDISLTFSPQKKVEDDILKQNHDGADQQTKAVKNLESTLEDNDSSALSQADNSDGDFGKVKDLMETASQDSEQIESLIAAAEYTLLTVSMKSETTASNVTHALLAVMNAASSCNLYAEPSQDDFEEAEKLVIASTGDRSVIPTLAKLLSLKKARASDLKITSTSKPTEDQSSSQAAAEQSAAESSANPSVAQQGIRRHRRPAKRVSRSQRLLQEKKRSMKTDES